jgi:hypothetical protein
VLEELARYVRAVGRRTQILRHRRISTTAITMIKPTRSVVHMMMWNGIVHA